MVRFHSAVTMMTLSVGLLLLTCLATCVSAHRVHIGEDLLRMRPHRDSKYQPHLPISAAAVTPNPLPPQPATCATCTPIATKLVDFIVNKTDEKQIKKALEDACFLLNVSFTDKIVCDLLAGVIAKHAADVVEKIEQGLGWDIAPMICNFAGMCKAYCCMDALLPEQLHMSYATSDPTADPTLNIRWVTLYDNVTYALQYRLAGGASAWTSVPAAAATTINEGSWVGAIHRVALSGLQPGATYEYRVGTNFAGGQWTDVIQFLTLPSNAGTEARPLRFVQIGDMGWLTNFSGNTEHALTRLAATGAIDFILHVGDISYANGDMAHWDFFCREIAPIASRVPYLTVPGNHELAFNFSAYKRRFADLMPRAGADAPDDAMYYALAFPPAFGLVMMNSESPIDTPEMDATQVAWASRTLTAFNAQRAALPFVSTMHHRPLYCTGWEEVCNGGDKAWLNVDMLQGLVERMYYEQKVDVVMCGHVHDYERTLPVYQGAVQGTNYANATAPMYIVNGAGGCHESLQHPKLDQPWEAAAISEYGFLTVEVTPSRFSAKFVHASNGTVLDQWVIPK
jgi:hypothetical protein